MKTSAPSGDSRTHEDDTDGRVGADTLEEKMFSEEPHQESRLWESITESDFHDPYRDLPRVVADCVRAVFSTVAEFPPHGDRVDRERRSEVAEDLFCAPLPIYLPVMKNIERGLWEELDGRTFY